MIGVGGAIIIVGVAILCAVVCYICGYEQGVVDTERRWSEAVARTGPDPYEWKP